MWTSICPFHKQSHICASSDKRLTSLCPSWYCSIDIAIIDSIPAAHVSPATPSKSANSVIATTQSPARPVSRRSNITPQIYQFALGYPESSPENSPVEEAAISVSGVEQLVDKGKMGNFLFQWYAIPFLLTCLHCAMIVSL